MMLDRGVVTADGDALQADRADETLAVPETLHALVAARLDNLDGHRAPGSCRTRRCSGPRSPSSRWGGPERGWPATRSSRCWTPWWASRSSSTTTTRPHRSAASTASSRTLLQTVAYGTLGRKDRKARHLAAARAPRASLGRRPSTRSSRSSRPTTSTRTARPPDADDAAEIKANARARCSRAPASGPPRSPPVEEAQRYFEQAAELADEPARARAARTSAPARWRWLRRSGRAGRARTTTGRSQLLEADGEHPRRGARARRASAEVESAIRPPRRGARRGWSARFAVARRRGAGRRPSPRSPPQLGAAPLSSAGDVASAADSRSVRSRSPRRSGCRRCCAQTLITSGLNAVQRGRRSRQALALDAARPRARARARPARGRASRVQQPRRRPAGCATATRTRSTLQRQGLELATEGRRAPAAVVAARRSSAPSRSPCRALGRGARGPRRGARRVQAADARRLPHSAGRLPGARRPPPRLAARARSDSRATPSSSDVQARAVYLTGGRRRAARGGPDDGGARSGR